MTVAEYIKELERMPQDENVMVYDLVSSAMAYAQGPLKLLGNRVELA